ncbi:putative quinol monooxygenase [Nocardia wallacei]|uniref:putative quinol monooxygenase n=1 Tax=Nocardia wallacei TaxID=480035 RepID=UPI00245580C6|nr:antibiotic biosynthesis monooxygenase [Nocardia wallacei]
MLIVAGYLRVTDRDRYLARCRPVVEAARAAEGCLDYSLGADLLELDRVNVYERWTTRAAVEAFRGNGPGDELSAQITAADVREFSCESEQKLS